MPYEYKERERASWSEIDKRKDRSSHQSRSDRPEQGQSDSRDMSKYKEKLEKLFSPAKKIAKPVGDDLKKLRETTDRAQFCDAAKTYIAEFGLPEDWSDLEMFLRHRDVEVLRPTLERLQAQFAEQSEVRKGNFIKDLRLIEMTTRDRDLRRQVVTILKELDPVKAG